MVADGGRMTGFGRLEGRVALVTGAGQGIGRGIARALARDGAAVAVSGRRPAPLDAVVKELIDLGARAVAVPGDVGSRADAEGMVAAAVSEFGRLDALVNNAQSSVQARLEHTTDADVELAWRTGALGTFHCMRAALPHLKDRGGSVVNFGSSAAVNGEATFGSYAMAKEAIRGLSRVAAREWGRFGIRVNVICPTATSPASEEFRLAHPERFQAVMREIPLGRFGDPEDDIGRAVAALVSDDLSYLSGATLMLGGGREVQ
jgi:2-hydroxycyclohexanecarboxyl-CoA dehydrogenase